MDSSAVARPCGQRSAALLAHLGRRMQTGVESALAALGLRVRHLVALTVLRDHGDLASRRSPSRCRSTARTSSACSTSSKRTGLVERRRSLEDRRRHTVALTESGARRLAEAETRSAAEDDVLCAARRRPAPDPLRLLQQPHEPRRELLGARRRLHRRVDPRRAAEPFVLRWGQVMR
jgi:DNA-binding MarR family transcriptional regulator